MLSVHPTAIVSDTAVIGEGVSIGAYSIIGPDVKIGKNSKLHSHVVVQGRTILGEANEIFPFACLGNIPQDLKYSGEDSVLEIGSGNKIREYVTIQPGTKDGRMKTSVGDFNLFMANSHVGHDCIIGDRCVFANSVALAGHVEIGNHVILGGLAGVHQFSRIGSLAFIGAGAMVSLDVPPYCIAQGDRALMRGLNIVGLKRAGVIGDDLLLVKRCFKYFFSSVGHLKEKLENIPQEFKSAPITNEIVNFISLSQRGVISSARHKTKDESA